MNPLPTIPRRFLLAWSLGFLIDQVSKFFAQLSLSFYEPVVVIPHALILQLVHNYGAAYGILQNQRWLLIAIGFLVLGTIYKYRKDLVSSAWSQWGLTFLLIGSCGNIFDRVLRGYVVDFIYIYIFPVFNVADVCIDIGIGLFLIELFLLKKWNLKS